jgi:hypothetical protein
MTSTTLAELAAELDRQKTTKRNVRADTRHVSLVGWRNEELELLIDLPDGAEGFPVNRHAHQQIASHLKLPFPTYERLQNDHPDLLVGLANGLLTREPSKRLIRILDGRVRAVLSNRYQRRDNDDLLEHLLPVFKEFPGVQFKKCQLTDTQMYVKTFIPSMELAVRVGDVIRGGVIIRNSEVGAGSLGIFPYTDRLICTNGMIHTELGKRSVHLGKRVDSTEEAYEIYSDETMRLDDAAFFAKCADTLRACLNESVFESIVNQMRDLAGIKIDAPIPVVEELAQKQGLSGDEKDSVLKHLIEGGDLTAWGVVNGITATARDLDDADRQAELEVLAGRMTAAPADYSLA